VVLVETQELLAVTLVQTLAVAVEVLLTTQEETEAELVAQELLFLGTKSGPWRRNKISITVLTGIANTDKCYPNNIFILKKGTS
jgi:hypothetical protein